MNLQRRNKFMIFMGVALIVIGMILIYWNITYSPYKTAFHKDMEKRLDKTSINEDVCTQKEIEKLPEPFRKHCEYIGLVGSNKNSAVNVVFHNTEFVFDSNKGTIKPENSKQLNKLNNPIEQNNIIFKCRHGAKTS